MSDGILIGSIPKARGEQLRVGVSEYKGGQFLDIRVHFQSRTDQSEFLPTKKGVTIRLNQIDELIALLERARIQVRQIDAKAA